MLVLASATDTLVTFATNVIDDIGLPGIFALMLLESACIPIPSEATMLFAGFSFQGGGNLLAITAAGVLGNVAGSWLAYAVGYYGRTGVLERHGAKLHIRPAHLEWADRWFERYGARAVFFSRMLPIIRTFISLPAGAARMSFWRFTTLTVLGCVPWVLALAVLGQQVGGRWMQWRHNLEYVDYAVAVLVVAAIIYLVIRRRRNAGPGGRTPDSAGATS